MKAINYSSTPEFDKDLKKLLKRFRTLKEDFEIMKIAAIETYHLKNVKISAIVPIKDCCKQDCLAMKIRKMACKSLKGKGVKSGLRVIYVFNSKEKKVTFTEIYYKQDQENGTKYRLLDFMK